MLLRIAWSVKRPRASPETEESELWATRGRAISTTLCVQQQSLLVRLHESRVRTYRLVEAVLIGRLGPSVEHVIKTQPSVVDLLLSFAHTAASSQARMSLPLHLS